MLNESRNNSIISKMKQYCSCRETEYDIDTLYYLQYSNIIYHSEYAAWFLDAESLHHLKHIHNTLSLAALNHIHQSAEHSRTTHCVTEREREY